MTPHEIALAICEPWFNGDPCEGCECHKVCTKLVERIEDAIKTDREWFEAKAQTYKNFALALQSERDRSADTGKTSDHIADASKMVANVRADRTVEPIGYGVFEDGNLHDSFRLEHEAKLFAALKGEHAEVGALYRSPPTSQESRQVEPVAVWELQETGWEIICDGDWIKDLPIGTKLYTAPPKREPLHDMAVFDLSDKYFYDGGKNYGVLAFARAIERAHGIGGEE